MSPLAARRGVIGALAGIVATVALSMGSLAVPAGATQEPPAVQAGMLALANVGKGAGTCSTVNASLNSLGGTAFWSSCHGYAGVPEFWCADFAGWAWQHAGLYVAGITAAAASFVTSGAGTVHTDPSYVPQVGDAVVFNYDGGSYADHVGLVGAVNADGSVVIVNGDFGGRGSGAAFARTSLVKSVTVRASSRSVGSTPGRIGMTITDYVTPRLPPPASPTVTVDGTGHPNAFWRDATGQLRHTWASSGVWQATDILASGLLEDPVAGSLPDAAWVGTGGSLRRVAFDGSRWAAPETLPTGGQRLSGRPAIATDATGVENIFWRGPDHRLYHDYLLDGSWVGPEAIADDLRSDPVAVSVPTTGELVVLARGRGHSLQLSRFASGRWRSPRGLDLATSSVSARPSAVLDPTGSVDVFWRQPDGQLETARLSGVTLSAPTSIGTSAETAPAGTTAGTTVAATYGAAAAREVRISSSDGTSWTPDQVVVSGRMIPGAPAIVAVDGGLCVLWITRPGALQAVAGITGAWDPPVTVWHP